MSAAENLVRRLRATQQRRDELHQLRDRAGELAAADLATSLCADVPWAILRDALLHATNPASTPPIPVVFGPQDVAALVGRDEIQALLTAYGQACVAYGSSRTSEAAHGMQRTFRELWEAIDRLCRAAPAYELGGGRAS